MQKTNHRVEFQRIECRRIAAPVIKVTCGLAIVLAGLSQVRAQIPAKPPEGMSEVRRSSLPRTPLRGFGNLAGEFVSYETKSGGQCSLLVIQCEDEAKAKIAHAKYLSDLHLLIPVKDGSISIAGIMVPTVTVPGQGAIAAFRNGSRVCIATATDATNLSLVLKTKAGVLKGAELTPTGKPPMYLDTWDQHGFRFYYRPWETPKGVAWKDYPVHKEFDFANQNGKLGFIFWAQQNECDTAEGLNNNLFWDWAERAATRRNLPIVINTSSGPGTWLLNHHREETIQKMPDYCGSFHSVADAYMGGTGVLSWNAGKAADEDLKVIQQNVKKYSKQENTLDYLEPHGELRHGPFDIFLEYGPVADKTFRTYLKQRYRTLGAVSTRWAGDAEKLNDWSDVHVPEVASFLGYNANALNLSGTWRVGFGPLATSGSDNWIKPEFDDAAWPTVTAPGDDHTMFLPKQPAVYRRHFTVDAGWLEKHGKSWLYLWDLNLAKGEPVIAYLNGRKIGEDEVKHATPHWIAYETSSALKAGDNEMTLCLPQGYLGYRVYLAPTPPLEYPHLGSQMNARWVDFTDWMSWSRVEMCRRGMEMIRQVDPNRSIICMAPDSHTNGIRQLCVDYGARFHNTGYMGGFWADYLPMLMRGVDLPFSLEPGGPAKDLPDFKHQLGLWLTEGVNAIHYFIHIGDVLWNDDIRNHFQQVLPVILTTGKIHIPKSQVALLYSDRVNNLTGYPWGSDVNTNLPSGYWPWRINEELRDEYRCDGLTTEDFSTGAATAYPVIIDTNTSIMDEALVGRIEKWVKAGGIFITYVQTGRHTPEKENTWPICRLTGYRVSGIDPVLPDGRTKEWHPLKMAPGQTILDASAWKPNELKGNGLSLVKVAPECQDLLLWSDGAVAAGMRPLGKGAVLQIGAKFSNNNTGWDSNGGMKRLFCQLLSWKKVPRVPALAHDVILTHSVSNNGLYDAWTLWNESGKKTIATDLVFRDGVQPATATDVKTGQPVSVVLDGSNSRIAGLTFEPGETKMFLTPRKAIAAVGLEWFTLQRQWWRGTTPITHRLPELTRHSTLDLTDQWVMKSLDEKDTADQTALAAPTLDDTAWMRHALDVWMTPEEFPTHHAFFRKSFTVPKAWQNGDLALWLRGWVLPTSDGGGRVWLDGKEIKDANLQTGFTGLPLTETLKPGSTHCLAVEIFGGSSETPGVHGNTWLAYTPHPQAQQDLAGEWMPTRDTLVYTAPIKLPGAWDAHLAKSTVRIDAAQAKRQVYLHMEGEAMLGVIVNGHMVRRHHHLIGNITHLNITPWVKFGADNRFELFKNDSGHTTVKSLSLYFYDKGKD